MGERLKSNNLTERVPFWKALAFSSRSVSRAVAQVLILSYLTFYCTNMLLMPAELVGVLLLASKVFDAVSELVCGVIIDRTNTKWGRARPYEISVIGLWLSTWLMFSCPDLGMTGKAIWVFFTYTFANSIFETLLGASESVYYARAFKTERGRSKVVGIAGILVTLGAAAVSIAFPIMMQTMGATKSGWSTIVAYFALPLGIIGMGRFLFVKEIAPTDPQAKKLDLKSIVDALKSGPYVYLLAGCTFFTNVLSQLSTAVGVYYFTYIVGDIGQMSLVNTLSIVTPFLLLLVPVLLRKFSLRHVVIGGAVLGVVGCVIRAFAGGNLIPLVVAALLCSLGTMPISYYWPVMNVSCMDYHEWKTGERIEGIFSAINNFSCQIGSAIASWIIGVLMGAAHFDGSLAVQPDSANNMIVALYSWVSAIAFIGIIVLMCFFTLDKMMPKIKADLEAKHNHG